jgi:hypothetical protein
MPRRDSNAVPNLRLNRQDYDSVRNLDRWQDGTIEPALLTFENLREICADEISMTHK